MAKLDIVLSADFLQETPDLKLSGNLELSLSQISAGNLRFYAFWKIDHSFFRKFLQISKHRIFIGKLEGHLFFSEKAFSSIHEAHLRKKTFGNSIDWKNSKSKTQNES